MHPWNELLKDKCELIWTVFLSLQEPIMYDFECHYRKDRWQTVRYFDFIKDFLIAAQNREDSDDCDPPPCPTTPYTVTTKEYLEGEYLLYVVYMCIYIHIYIYMACLLCLLTELVFWQFTVACSWHRKTNSYNLCGHINEVQYVCVSLGMNLCMKSVIIIIIFIVQLSGNSTLSALGGKKKRRHKSIQLLVREKDEH